MSPDVVTYMLELSYFPLVALQGSRNLHIWQVWCHINSDQQRVERKWLNCFMYWQLKGKRIYKL